MAKHARYTKILVDEFDFSSSSNSLSVQLPVGTIDTTAFGSTGLEWVATYANGQITHAGYFADNDSGIEKALKDRLDTSGYVTALFGTDVTMCPAYVLQGSYAGQLQVDAPVDGVIAVNGTWLGGSNGGIRRGHRVFTGTISATGAQTGVDFGAAGSAGGYAWLHVTAITGTATNATITVESDTSAGFGTAATEGTFTFSAIGGYQISLSGTVNRHIRLNCTSLGGATDFTVVGIVALSGVTY